MCLISTYAIYIVYIHADKFPIQIQPMTQLRHLKFHISTRFLCTCTDLTFPLKTALAFFIFQLSVEQRLTVYRAPYCRFSANGAMDENKNGYNPTCVNIYHRNTHFSNRCPAFFLAHEFEFLLSHSLTKFCPPLFYYTVLCHAVLWYIAPLRVKTAETQCCTERKSLLILKCFSVVVGILWKKSTECVNTLCFRIPLHHLCEYTMLQNSLSKTF